MASVTKFTQIMCSLKKHLSTSLQVVSSYSCINLESVTHSITDINYDALPMYDPPPPHHLIMNALEPKPHVCDVACLNIVNYSSLLGCVTIEYWALKKISPRPLLAWLWRKTHPLPCDRARRRRVCCEANLSRNKGAFDHTIVGLGEGVSLAIIYNSYIGVPTIYNIY